MSTTKHTCGGPVRRLAAAVVIGALALVACGAAPRAEASAPHRPFWNGTAPAVWASAREPVCRAGLGYRFGVARVGARGAYFTVECLREAPGVWVWSVPGHTQADRGVCHEFARWQRDHRTRVWYPSVTDRFLQGDVRYWYEHRQDAASTRYVATDCATLGGAGL